MEKILLKLVKFNVESILKTPLRYNKSSYIIYLTVKDYNE